MDEESLILAVEIALTVLAAFCIWLGVRILNRRERWTKRTGIALPMMLVMYALSIGPVYRYLFSYGPDPPEWAASALVIYCVPVELACERGPEWVKTLVSGYLQWWLPPAPFFWVTPNAQKASG